MRLTSSMMMFTRINFCLSLIKESIAKGDALLAIATSCESSDQADLIVETGVSKILHDIYRGYERIFEEIATVIDGGKPSDETWSRGLLMQMCVHSRKRPAVITDVTRQTIQELFLHRQEFRDNNLVAPRVERIRDIFSTVKREVHPQFVADLQKVADFVARPQDMKPKDTF